MFSCVRLSLGSRSCSPPAAAAPDLTLPPSSPAATATATGTDGEQLVRRSLWASAPASPRTSESDASPLARAAAGQLLEHADEPLLDAEAEADSHAHTVLCQMLVPDDSARVLEKELPADRPAQDLLDWVRRLLRTTQTRCSHF